MSTCGSWIGSSFAAAFVMKLLRYYKMTAREMTRMTCKYCSKREIWTMVRLVFSWMSRLISIKISTDCEMDVHISRAKLT